MDLLLELILDERLWLPGASFLAALWGGFLFFPLSRGRGETLRALNLFYGFVIGVMAAGHLAAVSIHLGQGSLEGGPAYLYVVGCVVGAPALGLAWAARRGEDPRRRERLFLVFNLWLGTLLGCLGVLRWPLAAPAALNLLYQRRSRRGGGRGIVVITILLYGILVGGSLFYVATGRTFD